MHVEPSAATLGDTLTEALTSADHERRCCLAKARAVRPVHAVD